MSAEAATPRDHRLTAVMREEETVTRLELFFDLVFVLALTQCTALMADDPTWEGLARGLLVLAVLWWSWVGYAWLTSVVDPEEGAVRLVIFAAMAAFLVASLCVPGAFDESALVFALGLAIGLFAIVPVVYELHVPALGTLAILAASLVALIVSETRMYGEARARVRSELRHTTLH